MDAPTARIVNGVLVPMTAEDIAETVGEWQRGQAEQTAAALFDATIAKGFLTEYGFCLPIDDDSRSSLIELRTQISEGLSMGLLTNDQDCPVQIRDTMGILHSLSVGEVRMIIFLAGNYYAQLLQQYRQVVDAPPA